METDVYYEPVAVASIDSASPTFFTGETQLRFTKLEGIPALPRGENMTFQERTIPTPGRRILCRKKSGGAGHQE
jgi:hypothetical protein